MVMLKNVPLFQTLLYILVSIYFICLLIAATCWFINLLGSSIQGNLLITTISFHSVLGSEEPGKAEVTVKYRGKVLARDLDKNPGTLS